MTTVAGIMPQISIKSNLIFFLMREKEREGERDARDFSVTFRDLYVTFRDINVTWDRTQGPYSTVRFRRELLGTVQYR